MRQCVLPWKRFLYVYLCVLASSAADPKPAAGGDPGSRFESSQGKPSITEHPEDAFFARGEPETLNCKASGDPTPTITWFKDGQPVETSRDDPLSHRLLLSTGQLFFLRVIHSKTNQPDVGEYYCNATNIHGTTISKTAHIQIAVLKDDFRQEPTDTVTAVGQTVVMHCKPPRGKPEPKVIWRKNDDLVQTSDRIEIQDDGDLSISLVEKQDVGEYVCTATNKGGDKHSRSAQLQVLDVPVFQKLPKDVSVEEGKTAEFDCDVVGDGPIKVQWSKEGGAMRFSRAKVSKDHSLRIDRVEAEDQGVYICSAENAAGNTRATARLVVYSSPSFLIRPQDQVVARGRTVSLQCVAKGNPNPTVFWSKDSSERPQLIFPNGDTGRYMVAEDGMLHIQSANDSDAGVYICEALNTRGQARASATVKIIAHDARPPPIILIGPQNQTLPVDSVAMLRCKADGDPKPIIRWYRDGRPLLLSDPRLTLLDSGTLQISDLKIQDTGTFTCKAISETGETTWDCFLAVSNDIASIKSSAMSSLPDPPTKPVVSDITDTTVHLSWAPGMQNGQAPVFAYYVEYFGYETTDGWVVASRNVKRESYTVENLKANTSYLFLIRAVNANGVGYPSLVSNPVRMMSQRPGETGGAVSRVELEQRLSGEVVELVNVQSINSSAISLAWRALKSEDIIEGFQIEYRHILNMRDRLYGKSHALTLTAVMTSYTLTQLDSYSWYEICVSAYSRDVRSRCSKPVKVQTAQIIVARAPENVMVQKNSSSVVSIIWSPPNMKHAHFMVTGYKIYCMSQDHADNCSLDTNQHTLSARIRQLQPDKEYTIRVAAMTDRGLGAWSDAYVFSNRGVYLATDSGLMSTTKPIPNEEPEENDLFKQIWFIVLIVSVGILLWVALCVFSVWLCKKRKNKKKMKDQRYYTGVPLHKNSEPSRNMMYPPQYGIKDQNINFTNDLDLTPELRTLLAQSHGKKEAELKEDNIYRMAGDAHFPEMKTFYQKVDPVAPYATTALIQQQNMVKQRQGLEHMFRPINQGYIQHSEGSADSCQKPPLSCTDSNPDHHSHCTTDHNHSDHMQSPTSDSASHTTDENGMLIKQKKKCRKDGSQKQNTVNWSELLPPPPEHPPPSECSDPPLYSEVRDDRQSSRSPLSPVSFSQLSACSCPNPHTQTPVSAWNMQVYSDNECPRCHSEKYYDPVAYCQEAFIKRTQSPRAQTQSPRAQTLQHVNINPNNLPNNCMCSPRATPTVNNNYQYSQPYRVVNHSNCATPLGDMKSNISRVSQSSHSDNEAPTAMPCFQSYKIVPKSEKDYRFLREQEWGPEPAPPCHTCGHDSGMGLEEDGSCMDRACQSSLPSLAPSDCGNNSLYRARPPMSSSAHVDYKRSCDSPSSEGEDYAADSDLDQHTPRPENWNENVDARTDCSSVHSSTCSSGDGTFLTEEDFASAVARAAEMSGLTVVGTTVCDLNKNKKEKRHRRQARPVSPGYSTDSNYGSIGVTHKPYPKSHRRKQMEQGRAKSNVRGDTSDSKTRSGSETMTGIYDIPYSRTNFVTNTSSPASPVVPVRVSSLAHKMAPSCGYQGQDRGGYSSYLHENLAVPLKEDVV